ncbi:MAG: hypothetical protein PHV61_04710 [Limnochordia bacterium]|jgi:hypothetical protein|nr:hypothetical protein [Limnochordia bacterium]MDD2629454.1 hypothetical protein [Limnochordia bacterium]MDD4517532.1 hypothetical protein [Limnochordia bacterium]
MSFGEANQTWSTKELSIIQDCVREAVQQGLPKADGFRKAHEFLPNRTLAGITNCYYTKCVKKEQTPEQSEPAMEILNLLQDLKDQLSDVEARLSKLEGHHGSTNWSQVLSDLATSLQDYDKVKEETAQLREQLEHGLDTELMEELNEIYQRYCIQQVMSLQELKTRLGNILQRDKSQQAS